MDNQKLAELLFPEVVNTPEYYEEKFPYRKLPNKAEVTRMAPSPTGFIHLGNLYSALADERIAHRNGGVFYLRIEDTDEKRKVVVTGLEMFRKTLDYAEAGDNVGVLLRGVQRTEIQRGQVLAKPGTIHPHTKFRGQVYVLTKDEGGRHTPFFNNYRPQFYFRTTDVTGVCNLPEGTEMCMPGDNVEMTVELIHPVAMEEGLRFAIREGGRTVGSGKVATIIE